MESGNKEFKIAITNLGKYNEGILNYKWVSLPTDEETMKQAFKDVGIGSPDEFGNPYAYEEYFITDYDIDYPGISSKLGEYTNLNELNYLAALLEEMNDYDYDQFLGLLEIEGARDISDLINYAQENNRDCVRTYDGCHDYESLGYYLVDEFGIDNINFSYYIDYEKLGRDIRIELSEEELEEYGYEDLSDYEIGEQIIDDLGIEGINNPEYYFDHEGFGRDFDYETSGMFLESGDYAELIDEPQQLYEGRDDIPEDYVFTFDASDLIEENKLKVELIESIADYQNREFSSDEEITTSSLKDSNIIGIAYTTTENDNHEIQVDLNLEEMALIQKFDGVEIYKETFSNDVDGLKELKELFDSSTFDSFTQINEKAEKTLEEKLNIIRDDDGHFKEKPLTKEQEKPSIIGKVDQYKKEIGSGEKKEPTKTKDHERE